MIYFARLGPGGPIKVGTTIDLLRRLKEHEKAFGVEVIVLGVRDGGKDEERRHHRMFAHLRLKPGESGPCERFRPGPELLDYIRRECRMPDLFDGAKEGVRLRPMRVHLTPPEHRLLRIVAGFSGKSMAALSAELIERKLKDEAVRFGVRADLIYRPA